MHPEGYFALLLAPGSSALLKGTFATLPVPIAHHCTIRHGTRDPAHLPPLFGLADLGREYRLQVTGLGRSRGVEAVVVALILPDGLRIDQGFSHNAIPHVTVATDGETEASAANAMLAEGFTPIEGGPLLAATLLHSDMWAR